MNQNERRPLIGITPGLTQDEDSMTISVDTTDAILKAGGVPMILPLTSDETQLHSMLFAVDGVLFSGGGDVNPLYFGEFQHMACGTVSPRRDEMELPLARMAYEMKKPTLGICRGCQVMNIALGGDVWQDLPSECPDIKILHRQKNPGRTPSHPVTLTPDSLTARITGKSSLMVNSFHHQAIRKVAHGLMVNATAPDGVIEGAEAADLPFFLGVQWHPERLWRNDPDALKIFEAFVAACVNA